jgi:hypothetical protein
VLIFVETAEYVEKFCLLDLGDEFDHTVEDK